jgi:protein-disulfide isomerase
MNQNDNFRRYLTVVFAALALAAAGLQPGAAQESSGVLSRDSVLRDPDIPDMGNPSGDLTIVEYFDYQCPYCKRVAPVLGRVVKDDGKIRLVIKDWPIFGPVSSHAAQMVLAAKFQGKYVQAHNALIAAKGKLSEERLQEILKSAGVDVERAAADLGQHQKQIGGLLARNNIQAEAFGFQGTPAFIIGTYRVPGALSEAGFKRAISDARALAAKR